MPCDFEGMIAGVRIGLVPSPPVIFAFVDSVCFVQYPDSPSAVGPDCSKVASARIFGEILKREAIDDLDNFSRDPFASLPSVADIAAEFLLNVSRTHRLPLKAGHVINLSRSAGRRKGRANSRRSRIPAWWAIAGYSFTAILNAIRRSHRHGRPQHNSWMCLFL
jgi:hypothetical protein